MENFNYKAGYNETFYWESMVGNYFYPDVNDVLTLKLIEEYGNMWYQEEQKILNKIRYKINKIRYKINVSLDIGCGTGRLIPWITHSFNPFLIICLEPDIRRLIKARKTCKRYYCTLIRGSGICLPFRNEIADLVILSHVIQHIPTYYLKPVLSEAVRVTKKGGFIIIMTTFSDKSEYFMIVHESGGKQTYDIVDINTFNKFTLKPIRGYLPVWKFNLQKLELLFKKEKLKIILKEFYHKKPECIHKRKRAGNLACYLDVAYLLKKEK